MLEEFRKVPGIVIVYGSVAKEKSRTDSDIDIAIIGNKKAKEVAEKIANKIFLKNYRIVSIKWFPFSYFKKI